MIRRKRGALGSVFLPAWQGWRTQFARAGNNRSRLAGLLSRRNTASHRCFLARIQGAPPRSAPGRTPGCRLFPPLTLPSERIVKNKKRETPACLPPNRPQSFLRRHDPHQVKGSEPSAPSQPASADSPVFAGRLYTHPRLPVKRGGVFLDKIFPRPLQTGGVRCIILPL